MKKANGKNGKKIKAKLAAPVETFDIPEPEVRRQVQFRMSDKLRFDAERAAAMKGLRASAYFTMCIYECTKRDLERAERSDESALA